MDRVVPGQVVVAAGNIDSPTKGERHTLAGDVACGGDAAVASGSYLIQVKDSDNVWSSTNGTSGANKKWDNVVTRWDGNDWLAGSGTVRLKVGGHVQDTKAITFSNVP